MNNQIRRLVVLLPLAVAAGCAVRPAIHDSQPEPVAHAAERRAKAARPTYNLAGYPPAVREGYIDGCESAKRSEFARKDAKRLAGDAQYEMGWKDGFSICARK
jgi:hypothetical protein